MGLLLTQKINLEHKLVKFLNLWRFSNNILKSSSSQRITLQQTSYDLNKLKNNGKCLLIGNGPNTSEIDLNQFVGSDIDIFTCNHSYKLSCFSKLNPLLHLIIDPKIISGEWNVSMIDKILGLTDTTHVLLDIRWYRHPLLANYIHNHRVNWINPIYFPSAYGALPFKNIYDCYGLNVMLASLSLASNLDYKAIAYCGMNGDGLFRQILDIPSHSFSDDKKDSATSSFYSMIESLTLHQHFMLSWAKLVEELISNGKLVYSLNTIGLLNFNLYTDPHKFKELPD
ncbi:hypothetical protein [Synechococcus sp. ROS8604]|uniref:hypothetical protein n=1 Tax=Synechococcus sp. ROS8604 TaxID=1442557 RepID=UPI0016492868|nr:hypothetical protein [Synechococcus sp. ROS8604]QNI86959.1 hypothetical protein SynROS8604_00288 [Synechococcus sp. ROS8604]